MSATPTLFIKIVGPLWWMDLRIPLFALGFGIFFEWLGWKQFAKMKRIIDTPTSKIRSMAMGPVEINGTVSKQEQHYIAPFSKKSCATYKVVVQEYRSSGKSGRWVTVYDKFVNRYFYVTDGTGTVLVDTRYASIDIKHSFFKTTSRFSEEQKQFFTDNGITHTAQFFAATVGRNLRVYEYVFVPGQKLYLNGEAVDNPFVKDGSSKYGYEDTMVCTKKENILLISDKTEEEMVKKYKLQSFLMIIGGGALIVVGISLFIFIFIGG